MTDDPEPASVLYLQITEAQAPAIAQFDLAEIRNVVVECARFMCDCEWGGLIKYRGDPEPVEAPKKRKQA